MSLSQFYNPQTDTYMSREEMEYRRQDYEREQMRRMQGMNNPYANQGMNQGLQGFNPEMKQQAETVKKKPEHSSGMNPLLLLTGE
jgi:hypothetical protein